MKFVNIYCQETNCPYHKSHCCLCEVTEDSVKMNPQLTTRNKCKQKNSKVVIGKPAA